MKTTLATLALGLWLVAISTPAFSAETNRLTDAEQPPGADVAELAKKLNNPTASLIST